MRYLSEKVFGGHYVVYIHAMMFGMTLKKWHWIPQHWALSPSEDLRRKSELLANRLKLNCGPSWVSQAVFWNGSGSIVAPDLPTVLPDPYLYAKAVAGAINHAAALPVWDQTSPYYENAVIAAIDIAQGGNGGLI